MDQREGKADQEKAMCACTNPTHFLGRCQAGINPPNTLCDQCMKDHFTRNDDPTITIE